VEGKYIFEQRFNDMSTDEPCPASNKYELPGHVSVDYLRGLGTSIYAIDAEKYEMQGRGS